MKNIKRVKIGIIGAGPAGVAAAVQLKRSGFSPIVFEKETIGGLLKNANLVENYPGFPEGISGKELTEMLARHISQFDIENIFCTVRSLDYNGELFEINAEGNIYRFDIVLIASGTDHKLHPFQKINKDIEPYIYYEAAELAELTDHTFIIIGAGDAAFDYALNLAEKNKVTIINRSQSLKCLPLLFDRAMTHDRIEYIDNSPLRQIKMGETKKITVILESADGTHTMDSDYIIFALGRKPCLDFISDNVKERMASLINSGNLYMIGDVGNGNYRQVAIAVGEGVRAAMDIYYRIRDAL